MYEMHRLRLSSLKSVYTRITDPKFQKYKKWYLSFNKTGYIPLNCLNPVVDLSWLKNSKLSTSPSNKLSTSLSNKLCSKNSISTTGVRSSLISILLYLKDKNPNITAILPSDVYPVYHQIAKNILPFTTYDSLSDLSSWRKTLKYTGNSKVLLITNPLSPSGKYLPKSYLDLIERWINGGENRWIIVDAVYNYTNTQNILGPKIFWCTSLSKTYLCPEQSGIISIQNEEIINELREYVEEPHVDYENIINQNQYLPAKQQLLFDARWKSIQRKFPSIIEKIPDNGYTHVVSLDFETLMSQYEIIGIPIEVFGGSDISNKTVITCLNYNEKLDDYYYFTVASNFAEGYDKYSRMFRKNTNYRYPDKFFLCSSNNLDPGISKAQKILDKRISHSSGLSDVIIAIRTHQPSINIEHGYPIVNASEIRVDGISIVEKDCLKRVTVEDVYSLSLQLTKDKLYPWKDVIPRTISVLPIAKGCQARCPFCFSHGSISEDQQSGNYEENLDNYIKGAHKHNVQRAVITGGGEPTMLPHDKLCKLIAKFKDFETIVLITNGYKYSCMAEDDRLRHLSDLKTAGLTVLSISRHGTSIEENKNIMNLHIDSEKVAITSNEIPGLKTRWVCVIQKQGVHDKDSLEKYLEWAISTGVSEICFKELYISSSYESVYHDSRSNEFSRENQVPLSIIFDYARDNGWKVIYKLPWGSPVYEAFFGGQKLKIAHTQNHLYIGNVTRGSVEVGIL